MKKVLKQGIPAKSIYKLLFLPLCTAFCLCAAACPGQSATNPDNLPDEDIEAVIPDPATDNPANYVYVRAGASGSGENWSTALAALPEPLERGKVYWMAAGEYPSPSFAEIAQGDAWIQIRHATQESHGAELGWQASYAQQSIFPQNIDVSVDRVIINGQVEDGFKVLGEYGPSAALEVHANHVALLYIDIDGNFQANAAGYHIDGSANGLQLFRDDNVVAYCKIHDCADDGVAVGTSSRLLFKYNRVYRLMGKGNDGDPPTGPYGNGHSDGLEIAALSDSIIEGNYVAMASRGGTTACLYFNDLPPPAAARCSNLLIKNNVFYFDGSFAVYVFQAEGIQFVNNTVWGYYEGGRWGSGMVVGQDVNGLNLKNNIMLFVLFDPFDDSVNFNASRHSGSNNLFGYDLGDWPLATSDKVSSNVDFSGLSGNPRVDESLAPTAFRLLSSSPAVNAGTADGAPSKDFEGTARPQGASIDIGAFEFR